MKWWVALIGVLMAGCEGRVVMSINAVEPAVIPAREAVQLRVLGGGFAVRSYVQFSRPEADLIDDRYHIYLGNRRLDDCRRLDGGTLTGTVPPDLAPGRHDVRVIDPWERELVLEDAVEVVEAVTADPTVQLTIEMPSGAVRAGRPFMLTVRAADASYGAPLELVSIDGPAVVPAHLGPMVNGELQAMVEVRAPASTMVLEVRGAGALPGRSNPFHVQEPSVAQQVFAASMPVSWTAGECSPLLDVLERDAEGWLVEGADAQPAALSLLPDRTGEPEITQWLAPDCATPITNAPSSIEAPFVQRSERSQRQRLEITASEVTLYTDIVPAAPATLSFVNAPPAITAGECAGPIWIEQRDVYGNPYPVSAGESWAFDNSALEVFVESSCLLTVSDVQPIDDTSSVAVFIRGEVAGAASLGVLHAQRGLFVHDVTIVPGPAAALAFAQQPTSAIAGDVITPPVHVAVVDALGNLTPHQGDVTVRLGANPVAAVLHGTLVRALQTSVARFDDLRIDVTGVGFTLIAESPGLQSVESEPFHVPCGEDTDDDGECNLSDPDDDNDGLPDGLDVDPLDPAQCEDADGDGCDDCAVGVDGFGPAGDAVPANDGPDNDNDGACDAGDTDDDNDGTPDGTDVDPFDPSRCEDLDGDSCDDCSVGVDGLGPLADGLPNDDGVDTDGDGACDAGDLDDDNDGASDVTEIAAGTDPLDERSCGDSDGDGCDDCSVRGDLADDGPDAAPNDDGADSDGDGVCDLGEVVVDFFGADPMQDGSPFPALVYYGGKVYLGPRTNGSGAIRAFPDGSGAETVSFTFARHEGAHANTCSASPDCTAPYRTLGTTGCTPNSGTCGPDNEAGRALLWSGMADGVEYLGAAGARPASAVRYAYLSTDLDRSIDFAYGEVSAGLGSSAESISAATFFADALLLGAPSASTMRPVLARVSSFPSAPGEVLGDVVNLGAHVMPRIGVGPPNPNLAPSLLIDAMHEINGYLHVFNNGGCMRTTVPNTPPRSYSSFPGDWADCTPNDGAWSARTSATTSKRFDITPADRTMSGVTTFKGRLFVGRNTTAGPQLWSCNPSVSGSAGGCDPGDWSLVAPDLLGNLTRFGDADNTHMTLIASTSTYLYVGFDNATDGVVIFRTTSAAPGGLLDFLGEGGCLATVYPLLCTPYGGYGLGSAARTRIFGSLVLAYQGTDYVFLVLGNGSSAARVFRLAD